MKRGAQLGHIVSLETRQKIGAANRGKIISWANREARRLRMLGKKASLETRHKMSESAKKRGFSIQHRQNLSKAATGRRLSEETRQKLSRSHRGQNAGEKSYRWRGGIPNCINCSKKLCNRATKHKLCQSCFVRIKRSGENSNLWKGGRPKHPDKFIRRSLEYKLWRTAVFERDNYTCVWCKVRSGNGKTVILQADHIKPFAIFPEFRFAIDNGRTLCIGCHRKTDTYGNKTKRKK